MRGEEFRPRVVARRGVGCFEESGEFDAPASVPAMELRESALNGL